MHIKNTEESSKSVPFSFFYYVQIIKITKTRLDFSLWSANTLTSLSKHQCQIKCFWGAYKEIFDSKATAYWRQN